MGDRRLRHLSGEKDICLLFRTNTTTENSKDTVFIHSGFYLGFGIGYLHIELTAFLDAIVEFTRCTSFVLLQFLFSFLPTD